MKKIVCISDTHGQHRAKKLTSWLLEHPADILLFAGDLQTHALDDGKDFVNWLSSLPFTHKVAIFGNHDNNNDYVLEYAKADNNITFLNNESTTIDGINIFGSPYSITFGNWSFMKPDKELAEIYHKIPRNTNIILSHTPPFAFLDLTIQGAIAGSRSLLAETYLLPNLKLLVCGHIHEGYGKVELNGVTYVNASILNEIYKMSNKPVMIKYEEEK